VADVVELELLEHLAGLYFSRAQSSAAGTCWDAALRLCERSGDLARRAVQLARLAALGPPWGSIDEAEQADAAAQAALPSNPTSWRFDTCIELAMANERFGRLSVAIDYGRAAAELVRADDALAYALALVNLGNPLTGAGHPAEAVAVLTSALDVLDRHPLAHPGDGMLVDPLRDPRRVRCLALADLARALVFVGELDRALTTARRACVEEERLDLRGGRARRALAQIRLAQRQPRDALDALARSDASASAELLGASFAAELLLLAEAQCAAGDPASGQQTALDGIRICGRSGAHEYLAGLYLAEGRARLAQGDLAVEQAIAAARLTIEASGTLIFQPQLLQLEADTRAARHVSGADGLRRRAAALTRSMGSADRPVGPPEVGQHALTQRELEVLALVAEGRTNRHIAEALVVSDKTVKRHLSNILAKLGVASRAAAVNQGLRLGLL
jgi:DNA-binding CsgD family transcriptional regulator